MYFNSRIQFEIASLIQSAGVGKSTEGFFIKVDLIESKRYLGMIHMDVIAGFLASNQKTTILFEILKFYFTENPSRSSDLKGGIGIGS